MRLKYVLDSISDTYNLKNKNKVVFLNTGDIQSGKFLHSDYSDSKFLPGQAKKSIKNNDILFSEIRPANQRFALVNLRNPEDYVVSTKLMVLRCNNPSYSVEYVYAFLTQPKILAELQTLAESRSGTFPQITFSEIQMLDIPEISLAEQSHIVDILGSIDDKIENNGKIIGNLELFAIAEYQKITKEADSFICLGDVIDIFDSKRKPLSSREREAKKGSYRYFGATGVLDYVNNYLFDGEYVLLAEDGTVIDAEGFPIVQLVTGQFWVNNHAHIMQAKSNYTNYSLYVALKRLQVKEAVTGAVQLKINQANLCALELPYITPDVLLGYNNMIEPMFKKIIHIRNENEVLNKLKQLYLQKFFG